MLQSPRTCPWERGNVPVADAAACTVATIAGVPGVAVAAPPTGAVIFGVAAVAAAAGVSAAIDTIDFGRPGEGRWRRGIAFRYSPGSGSSFCRWCLAPWALRVGRAPPASCRGRTRCSICHPAFAFT